MAGLVFESVFLRQLAWLLGNSAVATAVVLAAFMGGLALGAALCGRVADRSASPLRLYGVLELCAAGSAALLCTLLGPGRELFLAALRVFEPGRAPQQLAEIALAFLLVLVPTVPMGGTLPALGRFVVRQEQGFVGSLGLLYGLNTLGAAGGVFLTGFYLFELVGVSLSGYLAAAVLAALGSIAVVVGKSTPTRSAPLPRLPSLGLPQRARAACLAAVGLCGVAVLGYEVVWTRLLSLPMRSFSYSVSLMLTLFLLGLCLGALGLRALGRLGSGDSALRALGLLQLGMAAWSASSLLWIPRWLAPVPASSFSEFMLSAALRAAGIVLPPTVLSGMALPLAARGFASSAAEVGADVGKVYAANTAGALLGALGTGLLLLPLLGAPHSIAVLAALTVAGGALALSARPRRGFGRVAAAVLLLGCLLPILRGPRPFVEAFLKASVGSDRIGELLFFHEGATDTIAVVRKDYGIHDPDAKSLITNGVAMSATVKPVWRYMALEGHLPLLLAHGADAALAVGVGTGITLGALASHPSIARITAVELSEGVLRGLRYFAAENGAAYRDSRVRLIQQDGRHYMELSDAVYDVITVEPPPPIVAGSVHLYSLDFYRLCLKRLRPHGVVAQWLPLHAQSAVSARMAARTFLDAFPHAQLWLPSLRDAVLVGSAEPLRLTLEELRASYTEPATRLSLESAYLETPESLLATYLLDREGIEEWIGDAPPITDQRPRMEFFRHQGGDMDDSDIGALLLPRQGDWSWVAGLDAEPELARAIARENLALRAYVESGVRQDPAAAVRAARLSRGTEFFLYRFGCAERQLPDRERCAALRAG